MVASVGVRGPDKDVNPRRSSGMSCLSSATRAFCQPSGRDCRVPLARVSGKRGARLGFQRDEEWTREPSRCTIAAVCEVGRVSRTVSPRGLNVSPWIAIDTLALLAAFWCYLPLP
jgi:hypothetical protein